MQQELLQLEQSRPVVSNSDFLYAFRFLQKFCQKFEDMEAYKLGLIDRTGNVLKSRKTMSAKELASLTYFDLIIINLKKIMKTYYGLAYRNISSNILNAMHYLLKEDSKCVSDVYIKEALSIIIPTQNLTESTSHTRFTTEHFTNLLVQEFLVMEDGAVTSTGPSGMGGGLGTSSVQTGNVGDGTVLQGYDSMLGSVKISRRKKPKVLGKIEQPKPVKTSTP